MRPFKLKLILRPYYFLPCRVRKKTTSIIQMFSNLRVALVFSHLYQVYGIMVPLGNHGCKWSLYIKREHSHHLVHLVRESFGQNPRTATFFVKPSLKNPCKSIIYVYILVNLLLSLRNLDWHWIMLTKVCWPISNNSFTVLFHDIITESTLFVTKHLSFKKKTSKLCREPLVSVNITSQEK